MSWLFALTVIPLVVVVGGLVIEFAASAMIGDDRAKYAAFALVLGYIIAKAQPSASEIAVDLPSALGAALGLALLWVKLFRWKKANG